MIQINKQPGQRMLELGGGENPHPSSDCNVDVRAGSKTHFTADFNEPLPIQSDEWDIVYMAYVMEHLSWRKVHGFLQETVRILKPGGVALFLVPNTEAQLQWIKDHPEGWDGKDLFDSAGGVLFGDQDYPENSHRLYLNPLLAATLLQRAGFVNVKVQPWGERATDLAIEAYKPQMVTPKGDAVFVVPDQALELPSGFTRSGEQPGEPDKREDGGSPGEVQVPETKANAPRQPVVQLPPPEQLYDKRYFNGGTFVGGYAGTGYADFPVHEVTARHILARRPASVLELGAARGYLGKRLEDAGVPCVGLEVSKHCWLTRVFDGVYLGNLCDVPWSTSEGNRPLGYLVQHGKMDLCFSIATMEHIPEQFLPGVIAEMARTCQRGLHGIDFGAHDDGFDKTHCSLFPRKRWLELFAQYAPGWPVEILDKEDLERGELPESYLKGDGKTKLNLGSFTTMYHHGWTNIDVHDLGGFAGHYKYQYQLADLRQGIPYQTQTVDLLMLHHMLEHFSYSDGLQLLRDCRRVLKLDGAMRIVVPDCQRLVGGYLATNPENNGRGLWELDEINDESAASPTAAGKLWALLCHGHQAAYDWETLARQLREAGFKPQQAQLRTNPANHPGTAQILRETTEMSFGLSLFADAHPTQEI